MRKFLDFKAILLYFTIWRIVLFIVAFLSVYLIPQFGGRFPYADTALEITGLPQWIWGFGNFDGVHYLRIAQKGYASAFNQAFFPLFPILIKFFASVIPKTTNLDTNIFVDPSYFYSAIILSNSFFLVALILLHKLFKVDFSEKVSIKSILLLLTFPTAFYFGSVYTESLFLLLTVGSLYFARKGNFLISGILAGFASGTRIIGVFLLPALLFEFYLQNKDSLNVKKHLISYFGLSIAPIGAILYMLYLNKVFGDPLYFMTAQPGFGAGRSALPIIPYPQVIYRYLKMFASVDIGSLYFFNILSEFVFGVLPFAILIILYNKIRSSYLIFIFFALIVPTLTGTFSSMPRYSLALFPVFPLVVQWFGKYYQVILIILLLLQVLYLTLFIRGYWVA